MGSLTLAAIAFAVVFVGGAIGLELQRALPESYTTGGPRDMTGAVVGLMTLLLALVLGLLIWTAYGVFVESGRFCPDACDHRSETRRSFSGLRAGRRRRATESSEKESRTRSPRFGEAAMTRRP